MDAAFALEVLDKAPYVTVSFTRPDGTPYGVPLSLARTDEKTFYFHLGLWRPSYFYLGNLRERNGETKPSLTASWIKFHHYELDILFNRSFSLGGTNCYYLHKQNCGKFLKRWEYQTTWPASWETYMQARKQQLELDPENQTGSKQGNEYVKAVYCHPAYLTSMQNTSWEMLDWMKHKLESRLLVKI